MQIIHPVTAETCRTYIGQPICAILLDGTQVFGTIDGVTETGLVFSQAYPGATILSTQPNKAKEQLSEIKDKARTSGFGFGSPFGGFGFGGGFRLLFPLIALLFLLPFFFIWLWKHAAEQTTVFQAINMQHVPVMLVLFDPTEDMQRTGNVTRIDMQLRSIKLEYDDDFDWFRFEDIIGAFA